MAAEFGRIDLFLAPLLPSRWIRLLAITIARSQIQIPVLTSQLQESESVSESICKRAKNVIVAIAPCENLHLNSIQPISFDKKIAVARCEQALRAYGVFTLTETKTDTETEEYMSCIKLHRSVYTDRNPLTVDLHESVSVSESESATEWTIKVHLPLR